jgi:hypothetical protein
MEVFQKAKIEWVMLLSWVSIFSEFLAFV